MKIFIDTEFTDLWSPELMSVGFAAECGARLYVEVAPDPSGNRGWVPSRCSRFVKDSVIPLLQGGGFACSRAEAATRTLAWLENFPRAIEMVADSAVDFHLLHDLWAGRLPRNLLGEHVEAPARHRQPAGASAARFRRHHALDDALALLSACQSRVSPREIESARVETPQFETPQFETAALL